jgi:hypothetical protein
MNENLRNRDSVKTEKSASSSQRSVSVSSKPLSFKTDTAENLLLAEKIRDQFKGNRLLIEEKQQRKDGKLYEGLLDKYKKLGWLRNLLVCISIASMIFTKPSWCETDPRMSVSGRLKVG